MDFLCYIEVSKHKKSLNNVLIERIEKKTIIKIKGVEIV
jgi:hypothetical protein